MPEGRKLVTILFADVTDSTALSEALDPEDVRALMDRYYQYAYQIVPAHGGTLEKFIGDAVMAVFGLPQAHGNDAERALAAALALREAVASDALLAGRLALRMAVNTGEVVATTDPARGEFLVRPAGTGKTRLLEEFLPGLDPAEGWQVATARCLPYGQSLTVWPLRGLLDELLGERFSLDRNNQAERDLRDLTAPQKVSGGFRKQSGERRRTRRSAAILATVRQQGHALLAALHCKGPKVLHSSPLEESRQPFYPASAWPGSTPVPTR
jgi:hypothetical protein